MFAYFRINDPYRVISILILLILIRLPAFISGIPLTVPELHWMLVGEKIADGALLYVELWDDTGPLSALAYWLIHELFGRSQLTYQIISLMLVTLQSFIFNSFLINYKVYNENTYIPGLIYAVLASTFFDFYTLSPVLMGLTFVLLALNNLFFHLENKSSDNYLKVGMYIGIAALFYLPNSFFVIAILLTYVMFTGTSLKRFLLFLYGFTFPFFLSVVFFYLKDGLHSFYVNYFLSLVILDNKMYVTYISFLLIVIVPVVFMILSSFKLFETKKYINVQVRYQHVMFLMILAALLAWWVSNSKAPFHLMIFVPFVSFFISHYFLLIKKRLFTEIYFALFFGSLMVINYGSLNQASFFQHVMDFDNLLVKETKWNEVANGKEVLMLDDNLHIYQHASLATPYLNWQLSSLHFDNIEYYDNLSAIFVNFNKDMPEVIIDPEGIVPKLFRRMPSIASRYRRGSEADVYVLRTGKDMNGR